MTTTARRAPTRGTEAEGAKPGAAPAQASPDKASPDQVSTAPKVPGAPAPRPAPAFAVTGDLDAVAAATLTAARDHLLGLQDPRGWWIGELETNVTMDAEDVLLRHFLGILTDTDL